MKGIRQTGEDCALIAVAALADTPLKKIHAEVADSGILGPYKQWDDLARDFTEDAERRFWTALREVCDTHKIPYALFSSNLMPANSRRLMGKANERQVELINPPIAVPQFARGVVQLQLVSILRWLQKPGEVAGGWHIIPFENGLCYDGNDHRDAAGPRGETLDGLKRRYRDDGVITRVVGIKSIRE